MQFNIFTLLFVFFNAITVSAEKRLYFNSLVNCMKNNTNIIPNYFSVVFDAQTRSINYDISITAKIQGKLKAYATVYAFGFDIIHETIDLCNLNLKQFCPLTPSQMEVQSVEYISQHYVNMVPNIAYTFPNLDAVARLIITDENNGLLGCLQASFNNGKTVSHEGAKWATAVVAGLGLLVSACLSLFGNSAAASRMSAAAISLFTYFQSVVIISMISVDQVPPIANAWAENLAWSMGLIRIGFMQKIFRWFVQATGGTPTQYLTSGVKSILTQRSVQSVIKSSIFQTVASFFLPALSSMTTTMPPTENELVARKDYDQDTKLFIPMNDVESNDYMLVLRGIDRIGYKSNIEPSSIVCTGFTFFILCLYVLVSIFFIYRYLNKTLMKGTKTNWIHKNLEYRTAWQPTFKGMLARYIFIGFPQLLILSLWEFTKVDSGAVVTVAVLFLILILSTMALACFQVIRYGSKSVAEHGNPAAILYGNPEVLSRYGFLYTMLNAKKYWFCAVSLGYLFVKSMFVALSQSSGKTQALAIWIIDMIYLGLMCHFLPYLDRFTNVLTVFIQVITTINSFLFTFFSGVYNSPFRVASVMGLVFFIMNAIVSLILLIVILALAAFTIFSKNPDAKFSPTKDDRTSFQQKHRSLDPSNGDANELFELGLVAKEHNENWADDMYRTHDEHGSPDFKGSDTNLYTNEQHSDDSPSNGAMGFLSRGLTRGKSLLNRNKQKPSMNRGEEQEPAYVQNSSSPERDANVSLQEGTDFLSSNNPSQTTDNNPFDVGTGRADAQNPFESESVNAPYTHIRNESHISGLTNNTAGLSVYGERIDPNDLPHDNLQSHAEEIERNSFYDDFDSEGSIHAQRRL